MLARFKVSLVILYNINKIQYILLLLLKAQQATLTLFDFELQLEKEVFMLYF